MSEIESKIRNELIRKLETYGAENLNDKIQTIISNPADWDNESIRNFLFPRKRKQLIQISRSKRIRSEQLRKFDQENCKQM